MNKNKGNVLIGIVAVVGIIGGFIALAALGSALNLITIPWLKFDSKVNMERNIVTKTYNADNALATYHWFKEKAGSIKTAEQNITVALTAVKSFEESAGPRKDWTFEDKGEHARLSAVYQGAVSYYNSVVNEYNAKASQEDKAIFKDELPLFFNLR